ncbi:MAG: hypothetical protein ABR986_12035 [Methanomassiliicoccales archaeon]|jgi:hypothetical protein
MSILHRTPAKLLSVMAILSLLVVSSAVAMAENQSAPLPTWTKGQIWAVGGERDLSNVLGENLGTLQDMLMVLGNISIDQLQMTGTSGAWAVFKVAEVKQDTYLLEYSVGLRIHGNLKVHLTGDMPREGSYLLSNLTKENKVVSGDADLDFILTSHGFATIDKATMAISEVVSTSVLDQRMIFNATNFPNYSTSVSIKGISVNMTYENFAIEESLHLQLASTVDFVPSLPLLQFPLTVGNNWTVNSKETFEGAAEGYFNATGLPSSLTSGLIEKNGAFTGSVRIHDLTKLGTMKLDNGTISPVKQDIQTTMQCVGMKSVGDGFGNNITVFDVKEKQSGAHQYYSPITEFLATALIEPQLDMLNGVVTLPGGLTSTLNLNTEISMASVDPAMATSEISKIGAYQGEEPVSLVSPSDTGSTVLGQDPTIIIFFVAAIIVIAAGVGGVLLLRNKKNKGP